jgi:hypothetical protein
MRKTLRTVGFVFFVLFCCGVLLASIRGNPGNPRAEELNSTKWQGDGPFELSPERGRFALTYSIVEDKSLSFSVPLARFVVPDLGYKNGKYVSLFAPGISYLTIPGYVVGKSLGISQIGTFTVIAFFALLNVLLIRAICIRLGTNAVAANLAGMTFIFATVAYSYAVTMYQHHVSTFLILVSIYILIRWQNLWSLALIWLFCATSIPIDYPNLILMIPIGLIATTRLIRKKIQENTVTVSVPLLGFLTFLPIALPLAFFMWFNANSYGNPMQFSGTVPSVREIDASGKPTAPKQENIQSMEKYINPDKQQKSVIRFFKSRNLVNGLYITLTSPDRGLLYFTPVLLLGIPGIVLLHKRNRWVTAMLAGTVAINIILYSMWGDPWGGWAFGSRYSIPGYAILSIFLGYALHVWRKKILPLVVFCILFTISVIANTAGALSSSANPPQVEILALERLTGHEEKYTFVRNLDILRNGNSKSYVFRSFAGTRITAWEYYLYITTLIGMTGIYMTAYLYFSSRREA